MCIAILTLADQHLDRETFFRCWESNSHGAGIAYSNGKEMVVAKELRSKEKFWALYKRHREANPSVPMLVHFRIRTHGERDIVSTQPIQINQNLAYIHNGVISGVPDHKKYSDTVMFKRLILSRLPNGFHLNVAHKALIEKFVGWSKLIFLDVKNRWSIINEKQGDWVDGIWYSNSGYKPPYNWEKESSGYEVGSAAVRRGRHYHGDVGREHSAVPFHGGSHDSWKEEQWRRRGYVKGTHGMWIKDRVNLTNEQEEIRDAYENGNESLLKAAVDRVVARQTSLLARIPKEKPDTECVSCSDPFQIGQKVYRSSAGKHWVCHTCMKRLEEKGILYTESDTVKDSIEKESA